MRLTLIFFLAATIAAFGQDAKVYVVAHIDVTPNYTVDAGQLLQMFGADSRKDKGAIRFELLQEPSRKNHFTIVEVWENQGAFDAHLEALHTIQFREKLHPMLGSPWDERLSKIMR